MDNLPHIAPLSSAPTNEAATDTHPQWQFALEILHDWLLERPLHDEQREHLALAAASVLDLMRTNDYSIGAKTMGRALMCVNCRRLNASQGKCYGQPLEKCPLLNVGCGAH